MANEILECIEDILKETDEIKTAIEERGLKSSIQVENIFENFESNVKISIVINY